MAVFNLPRFLGACALPLVLALTWTEAHTTTTAESCPSSGTVEIGHFPDTAPTAAAGIPLTGEPQEHRFTVPDGCSLSELRVALEWDIEAEDLDLEVYYPDGSLAGSGTRFNLVDGTPTEVVTVPSPTPGEYRAVVHSWLNVETDYVLTAAVAAGSIAEDGSLAGVPRGPRPRVVVAVIDSGINVYHQFYYHGSPIYPKAPSSMTKDVLDEFGIGPECVLELTRTGDFAADFAADQARGEWAKLGQCDVVWFKGTNVLAKSFSPGSVPVLPDDNGDTHGVGTSAAVLVANPDAIVLFLEGITDAAETFAMTHPAVDLITTSYGPIGSIPVPSHLTDSFTGVYHYGKLHFGACDNSPSTCVQDSTGGPWWSIGIAGFEETQDNEPESSSEGRQSLSGNVIDFIGDFTQTLPYCAICEDGYRDYRGGTSFATPRSAGTASLILLQARRALRHMRGIVAGDLPAQPPLMAAGRTRGETIQFTNWDLRRALEQAAWVPEFASYDPVAGALDWGYPVPPVAPWTVIGWGVLSPKPEAGVVDRALAALGLGQGPAPDKDPGFCAHQSSVIEARKMYWDFIVPGSETYQNAPDPDPFVYC